MNDTAAQEVKSMTQIGKPRLGFLGVGWIGLNRLQAVAENGAGKIFAVTEPNAEMRAKAFEIAPDAQIINSFNELLDAEIDGLVIATPSALHAEQAIAALERGISVFCQKPLARNAEETRRVVETAKKNDLLLAADFSYRFIDGMQKIRDFVQTGELGKIFAADLVFHNAYGPDKPWFFDRKLSGGGCLIDLGVHLIDLALWVLNFPNITKVSSRLFAKGEPLENFDAAVEDYVAARIDFENGTTANLACSWNLHAGREAEISATFYGTNGGATLRNLNGSFFDFTTEKFSGTTQSPLNEESEINQDWNWGGGAVLDWARRLARGEKFDSESEKLIDVAAALDKIYAESCRK